jgi:hypothetical protein
LYPGAKPFERECSRTPKACGDVRKNGSYCFFRAVSIATGQAAPASGNRACDTAETALQRRTGLAEIAQTC